MLQSTKEVLHKRLMSWPVKDQHETWDSRFVPVRGGVQACRLLQELQLNPRLLAATATWVSTQLQRGFKALPSRPPLAGLASCSMGPSTFASAPPGLSFRTTTRAFSFLHYCFQRATQKRKCSEFSMKLGSSCRQSIESQYKLVRR